MILHENITQQSEEWFQLRKGKITASRFKEFISATGGKLKKPRTKKDQAAGKLPDGMESYICELIGECYVPEFNTFEGNFWTDRGNELEPAARGLFMQETGNDVHEVGFATRDDKIVGCSPDGLLKSLNSGEWIGGLEIKCPAPKKHIQHVKEGVLPDEYKLQVHGSMAVTGLNLWYFMSYFPGLSPLILKVHRNEFTEQVSASLDEFVKIYADYRAEAIPKLQLKQENNEIGKLYVAYSKH